MTTYRLVCNVIKTDGLTQFV